MIDEMTVMKQGMATMKQGMAEQEKLKPKRYEIR